MSIFLFVRFHFAFNFRPFSISCYFKVYMNSVADPLHFFFTDCTRYSDFAAWKPHIELDGKKRLTREGESEMTFLAQRLRKRFPKILSKTWNNSTFSVSMSSYVKRYSNKAYLGRQLVHSSNYRIVSIYPHF